MTREVFVVLHKVGSMKRPAWALELASIGPLGRDSMNLGVKSDRAELEGLGTVVASVLGVQLVKGYVIGRSLWETILEEVGP